MISIGWKFAYSDQMTLGNKLVYQFAKNIVNRLIWGDSRGGVRMCLFLEKIMLWAKIN